MTNRRRQILGCLLLAAGAAMAAMGVLRGESQVVWQKAATICMECIGLG